MKYTLGELTIDGKGAYGIGAPAVDYDPNLYTYLRITDINDDGSLNINGLKSVDDENADKYLLKENDIVFARTGNSTGRSYFYEKHHGNFVYAGFLIKYSLDPEKVNPCILKYYTHSKPYYEWVHSFDTGATRGNINAKTFADMEIDLPDRNTQDKIVNILSSLDRKIELNNKINAQLEEMAQTLFKHWFVDFGPFKDGKFVESELGMIPEGWSVNSISELIKTTSGGTPSRKNIEYYEHGCIDWIKSKELNGGFIFDSEEKITDEAIKESSAKILPQYSVLIAMYGATVGEYGIISKPMACNQAICALMPNSSLPYSYLFLFAKNYKDVLTNMAIGSAQQNISQLTIKNLKIAYNKKAFISFHNLIAGILRKISKMTEENLRLASLRDTLLPKLMSGEINLEDYGGE